MLERFLNLLVRWRRTTLAVAVVSCAVLASFWPRLRLDDSAERWMPRSAQRSWSRFSEHFEAGDTIAVGMEFHRPVRDDDIEHLRALRESLEAIPGIRRVYDVSLVAEQIEGVPLTTLLAPDETGRFDLYRGALFDAAPAPSPNLETGATGPLSGRTLVTVCELREFAPAELRDERPRVVRAVDAALRRHRAAYRAALEGITFHLAGGLIVQRELEHIARQMAVGDIESLWSGAGGATQSGGRWGAALQFFRRPPLLPLCLVVALVMFAAGFRSLRALCITLLGAAWATVLVLGGVAAAGISLNVVTVSAPSLMAVVGMATAVHFAHYHSERPPGGTKRAVRWVGVPCLGAAMTTGTGFLMLAFNELLPIRELGFELFLGSLLAFLGVFLASVVVPMGRTAAGRALSHDRLARAAAVVTHRPRLCVAVTLGAMALLFFAATKVYVNGDPFSFFRPDSALARALRHLTQKQFGLYPLEVVMIPCGKTAVPLAALPPEVRNSGQWVGRVAYDGSQRQLVYRGVMSRKVCESLSHLSANADYHRALEELFDRSQHWKRDPTFQAEVAEFVHRAEQRPQVLKVFSTSSFDERLREFVSRMRSLGLAGGFAEALRTARQIDVFKERFVGWSTDRAGEGAVRITLLVHDTGEGFGPLVKAVNETLPSGDVEAFTTGTVATVVTLSENLVGGIAAGLTASLIVMAVLCGVLLGSARLALIAALPNLFPLVVVFGLMGLSCSLGNERVAVPINSGSAMVATIALGIALNDTIHFLLYYQRHTREAGMDVRAAIRSTFQHVGRPIVLTSVVHVAGFSIFLLSDFQPLYHFGLLSMLAMITALMGDLILLPNLLVVFDRFPQRNQSGSA